MNETRKWIASIFLIAALVAIAVVPSRNEIEFFNVDPLGQQVRVEHARWSLQSELYRREHSRTLARESFASAPARKGAVTVVRPASVPAGFQEQMQHRLDRTLLGIPRRDSAVEVRLVLALDTGDVLDAVPVRRAGISSADVFPPGSVAPNSCVIVARAHREVVLRPLRQGGQYWSYWSPLAQACAWYAAYGVPGKGVATWLDTTAFAAIAGPRPLLGAPHGEGWSPISAYNAVSNGIRFGRCGSGDDSACAKLMLAPPSQPLEYWGEDQGRWVTSPGWIGDRAWAPGHNSFAHGMLLRLAYEVGGDAFLQVWRSDEPLPQAIAAVRGQTFEAWIGAHVAARTKGYRAGPIPRPLVLIGSIGVMVGMIAIGATAVSRRGTFA